VLTLLRLQAEQRRYYRVPQVPGKALQAAIPFSDGSFRIGTCLDVAFGGAGVHFPLDQDPCLERGDELMLVFQVIGQPGSMRAVATVLFRVHMGPAGVRYAFAFPRKDEMAERVNGWWGRWFNRRRYKRFAPAGAQTLPVQLRWSQGQIDGRVVDISLGGLSMEFDRALGQGLETAQSLSVAIVMSEEQKVLRFGVDLRSTFVGTKTTRVGLEFQKDKSYERSAPELQRWIERNLSLPPPKPTP
jgi:hypothetical protein